MIVVNTEYLVKSTQLTNTECNLVMIVALVLLQASANCCSLVLYEIRCQDLCSKYGTTLIGYEISQVKIISRAIFNSIEYKGSELFLAQTRLKVTKTVPYHYLQQ